MPVLSSLSLVYFSATATEIPSLSAGVQRFLDQGLSLRVHARTQTQLFDEARCQAFVREALKADVCIIYLHGGARSFPAFARLTEELEKIPAKDRPLVHVQPSGGDEDSIEAAREHSTAFGTPLWDEMHRYMLLGGPQNFHSLLLFLHTVCTRLHYPVHHHRPCRMTASTILHTARRPAWKRILLRG